MPEISAKGAAILVALFFLLITGCASFDTRIPESWEPRIELNETPFHPQLEHHCGPAALITVLEASGVTPTYDEVADRIYVPGLEGSLQVELMAATRSFERIPFRLTGELQPVLAEFDDHAPAEPRLRAWRAVVRQWPDESLAWMGTGNARYELGALEHAASDFEQALTIKPDSWPARLNLAQVLLELDRPCQGQQTIESEPMAHDHPLNQIHHNLAPRLEMACSANKATE